MRLHLDWLLVLPTILLMILGLTVIRSVAPDQIVEQAIIMLVGLGLAGVIAMTNYQVWDSLSWGIYVLSLALLVITFIIGQTTRGAVRWISLGSLQLQTSEIAKPMLVIFFAKLASHKDVKVFRSVVWLGLLLIPPLFLIFRQPDLGSTLVVLSLWLGIIFAAGVSVTYIIAGFIAAGLLLPLTWYVLKDYQKARLVTFINPLSDPLKSGYNLVQSLIAVGSGMFWGRGLGQGTQSQLRFLPERHTDFIFASLAEELGFIGAIILIGLFCLLLTRILHIAANAPDRFGALICFGVFSQIAFQTFINIGMNIGLVPITGITLPLISVGGSSLLSTLISLGLVASVSLKRKQHTTFEIH